MTGWVQASASLGSREGGKPSSVRATGGSSGAAPPSRHPVCVFSGFPPDLRLRSCEDVRAVLREAQEAAMPEIQEQIQDYRCRPAAPLPARLLAPCLPCVRTRLAPSGPLPGTCVRSSLSLA